VGVPTGYSVDESHEMWNIGSASMAENKGHQYVLYFNEVSISVSHFSLNHYSPSI
jgi:hypothetical protein